MSEEELRKAITELRSFESLMEELRSRYQIILASLNDLQVSKSALEDISKAGEGVELFIDIGGGVYGKALLKDTNRFLVNAGSGILIERSLEETLKLVEKRINDLNNARGSIESQMSTLQAKIEESRSRVQALYEKLRK
ncbi:MAG: prefoldin subunit alpha [Thermoproteota archaeon]|nr:prefoldin subunit alpha [Candidatus Brockarchaeota archaeon]